MLFSPLVIPLAAIVGVFVYLAVQAIAQACSDARIERIRADLKISLAERGMSADEIERVVAARPGSPPTETPATSGRPATAAALPPHKSPSATGA